eukprot:1528035-Pyramimonas_sp.AAC.2
MAVRQRLWPAAAAMCKGVLPWSEVQGGVTLERGVRGCVATLKERSGRGVKCVARTCGNGLTIGARWGAERVQSPDVFV